MAKETHVSDIQLVGPSSGGAAAAAERAPIGQVSYSGKEVGKLSSQEINAQNKAAESYKSKNLERVESAKAGAETRKANEMQRIERAYKYGKTEGAVKGAVAGATATGVAAFIAEHQDEKKGTQPNHHVTDSKNFTKTVKK